MERHSDSDVELESLKRDGSVEIEDPDRGETDTFLEGEASVATSTVSWQEKKNLVLLYLLYAIQALPPMFSWYTMPILLRQQLSYTYIGTYYVSQYPYSIKVLWSPVVQSKYIPSLGRRRTWIVPCLILGGLILFWLAYHQDDLIDQTAAGDSSKLLWVVLAWLILTFLCANVRIAVDDWSLDMLSQGNVHLVSPTCSLAEISAGFFGFQMFLGFSSLGHPDAGTNGEEISTKPYFLPCGVAFIALAVFILLFSRDTTYFGANTTRSVRKSYSIILRIVKLRHVWTLMLVHMTSMIGFMANDSIALLQLVKNGFSDRDVAGLATISFPFQVLSSILISRLFRKYSPLNVWRTLFPYRLLVCLSTQVAILLVHQFRHHHWRWFIALLPYMASKQFEDMMFIALVAFHAQVSDPAYGGVYMPLLATTLNIRYDAMGFIYTKILGWIDGSEGLGVDENDAVQNRVIDGYQIVNLCAVIVAVPVFWFFLRPATLRLEHTERHEWRVGDGDDGLKGEYEVAQAREEDLDLDLDPEEEDDDDAAIARGSGDGSRGITLHQHQHQHST